MSGLLLSLTISLAALAGPAHATGSEHTVKPGAAARGDGISKKQTYDLYFRATGIKLKDIVSALGGNKDARKKIQKFAKDQDSMKVLSDFREELKSSFEKCVEVNDTHKACAKETEPQLAEIDKLQDLSGKADSSKLTDEILSWHLIVLVSVAKNKVIDPLLNDWHAACMKKNKMNEPACKNTFRSVGDFQKLTSSLIQYSRNKIDSKSDNPDEMKQIEELVATYEK